MDRFFQSSNNRPFYASRQRDSLACGIPALAYSIYILATLWLEAVLHMILVYW